METRFLSLEELTALLKREGVKTGREYTKKLSIYIDNGVIPKSGRSNEFISRYGKNISEILGTTSNILYVELEELIKIIARGHFKDKDDYFRYASDYNSQLETTDIPRLPTTNKIFKREYGCLVSKFIPKKIGGNRRKRTLKLATRRFIEIFINIKNISTSIEYHKKAREFNESNDSKILGVYVPTSDQYFFKIFGIRIGQYFGTSCICEYENLDNIKRLIINEGIKTSDQYREFISKYNSIHKKERKLPALNVLKREFDVTFSELLGEERKIRERKISIIQNLILHIEDLIYLDKTQLLQIGFLEKLPKNTYQEILDSPKGEPRRKLLNSISGQIEESKEEVKTFEDVLDEVIEEKETISEEESKFEDSLHSGLNLLQDNKFLESRKAVDEIFKEIESLDNFEERDYKGPEAIDYIISSEVQKIWNAIIRIPSPTEAMRLIEEYMIKKGGSKFFNEITKIFLDQYQSVLEMKIPRGYSFPFEPLMMQKLTAYMISTKHQFANWSETGTGKTISGVLTSRYIDSRVTIVIAVNSTIGNWTINSIKVAYPDSKVYTKRDISEDTRLDRNFYNYVVINYEEFQNPQKFLDKWKPFLKNNKVDFVILDEIQKVKSMTGNSVSIRREVIENLLQEIDIQNGRNLENEGRVVPVLALSATPVINNLNEGLSILSLLKGTTFDPNKRITRRSALACHFDIVRNGIRLVEELPAAERLITLPIKRSFEDISEIADSRNLLNKIDTAGCLMKIGECIRGGYLQKGVPTVIYTDLVTNVIDNVIQYLQGFGFRVGEFTGRNGNLREEEMKDFISGKYDVLIASRPISTGVDGLQYVCNRIIILVPSWTYAEYHQLVGRINRKGTSHNEVEIIIPTIEYVNKDGKIWSLDNYRLSKIWFKKTLDDVVMNGNVPDEIITWSKAYKLAEKSLREFIRSENTGGSSEKPVLATEIKPVERKPRIRGNRNQRDYFSEFQGFNQRISTTTIENVFTRILGTKEDWMEYHELRNRAVGNMQNQAINTIARDILRSRKPKVLGDMGCGMNQLKTLLPSNYEVISVDMYAADDTVKVCNILDTSSIIPEGSLDIVVYSLSLWGRDWRNILDDAYRVLDYDGKIIIVEPLSSSSKSIDKVKTALSERQFTNISVVTDAGNKYYYMTANK